MSRISHKMNKGIALLFVVLITSVILAIGLGISGIFIQQTKMMEEIGYSVVSFYAADSGIEAQLHNLYKVAIPLSNLSDSWGNVSFETEVKCGASVPLENCPPNLEIDPNCFALNFCLKSVGSYKKVKRAIEVEY